MIQTFLYKPARSQIVGHGPLVGHETIFTGPLSYFKRLHCFMIYTAAAVVESVCHVSALSATSRFALNVDNPFDLRLRRKAKVMIAHIIFAQ